VETYPGTFEAWQTSKSSGRGDARVELLKTPNFCGDTDTSQSLRWIVQVWMTAEWDGTWCLMSINMKWCTPGKGAILPFQIKWWALSRLWSLGYTQVRCKYDTSIWRRTDSSMKTPAQCLATMRTANGRLTIIREGTENRMENTVTPCYKPTVCPLFSCHVLYLQPVKGPMMRVAVWASIHTRNDHIH